MAIAPEPNKMDYENGDTVTVIKLGPDHEEVWRYNGQVKAVSSDHVLVEAYFNKHNIDFHGIPMLRGDRFLEAYFRQRWFNIYEIWQPGAERPRGWYCNICMPAEFSNGEIMYVDLALDILVYPDGRQLLLDMDEFYGINLGRGARDCAIRACSEVQEIFLSNPDFSLVTWLEGLKARVG